MSVFRADPDAIDALATAVGRSAGELTAPRDAGCAVLTGFGYEATAAELASGVSAAATWAQAWDESLGARARVLRDHAAVPTGSGPIGVALGAVAAFAVYFAAPGSGKERPVGRALAIHLLDALEQQQLDDVADILFRLRDLDEDEIVAFFEQLGVDMVGLFPQLVVDAGIPPTDLAPYLAPMGRALGVASSAGDGMALSFTGAEMMDGHEGSAITPAAYLDFGEFSPDFVFAAAGKVLAGFAESDLPLHGADYLLPDGATAGPDPRLPLLRAMLGADDATQRAFLTHLTTQGYLDGLVAPATRWADGGEAVGALLRSLVTDSETATAKTLAAVMRTVADAGELAPSIALGSAVAVAPHLASLVLATRFGAVGVTLDQTELRASLDAMPDAGGVVSGFLAAVLAHAEARATLHAAFSALLAATISARLDPGDTDSLAPVADDFGVLWKALFGLSAQSDLDQARRSDSAVGAAADAANVAIGYLLSGGAGAIASSGFPAWAANALGGAGLAEAPVEALLGGTGDAEAVLLRSFAAIQDAEAAATAILAAELHRIGVVVLPPALLDNEGRVQLDAPTDWDLLTSAFVAAGIDPAVWLNDIMAIFAYGIPDLR